MHSQTQEDYGCAVKSGTPNLFLAKNFHIQRNGRRFEEGKKFFSVFGHDDVNSLNITAVNIDALED